MSYNCIIRFLSLLQTAGRRVLEAVFPGQATAQLSEKIMSKNMRTIAALKSGVAYKNTGWMELVAGSRSECLGIDSGWGHEPADTDVMYLYGGGWGVRIPGDPVQGNARAVGDNKSGLVMALADRPPCYCTVTFTGYIRKVVARMGETGHRRNPIRSLCKTIMLGIFGILTIYVQVPFPWIVICTVLLFWFRHSHPFRECQPWLFVIYHISSSGLLFTLWGVIFIAPLIWLVLSRHYNFKHASFVVRHFDSICSFPAKTWDSIGAEKAINCFVERKNHNRPFLSSPKAFNILCDVTTRRNHKTPSLQFGVKDLVPGLVCSGPFPCINEYTRRNRWNRWPHQESLDDIASIPGIIVPTGNTKSPNCTVEWRYSFSPQELRLAQDMPSWVKAGYRAFKYTYKSLYKKKRPAHNNLTCGHGGAQPISKTVIHNILFRPSKLQLLFGWDTGDKTEGGRKYVSSYHMKTVLLWSLEQESTWQEECCFRIMILLLRKLVDHLATGVLPHYFNPHCNLLENMLREDLNSARSCAEDILYDPVQFMVNAPSDTRRIQRCGVDLSKLNGEYKNILGCIKV